MKPSERRKRFCQDMLVCGRDISMVQSMTADIRSMSAENIKGSLANAIDGFYQSVARKYPDGEMPDVGILEFLVLVAGTAFAFAEGGGMLECYTNFKPQDN